ncbi:hypothetical protein [Mycobacterium kubicae]|uniref:Uncharacterized protein n=1 Tax=Mycobacterium kubicae TaxID=120959 RepID=A0AAX1JHD8_9MYCO|nr:hypothetical protein [Mycobacterium kubicae]MCV7097140.1 hypothetical protein [Mycobacterium kubicae]OBK49608.1 hypothetical protein A5657_21485 [Mycobacterium kubicae]ORW03228.1 hypothetical protein AWC13_02855 [Mycobacterium kubicae]QNI06539.1 hypothetical protein GAN17_09675 [Mycobacterium kubicae]QNI11546.1 hypothetical protein GAN18_10225 [Mycobacterium kubicae]
MSWTRYQGRALADPRLHGDALHVQLEDHVRVHNPQLTDVRLERACATDEYDTTLRPPRRWYVVTYVAEGV